MPHPASPSWPASGRILSTAVINEDRAITEEVHGTTGFEEALLRNHGKVARRRSEQNGGRLPTTWRGTAAKCSEARPDGVPDPGRGRPVFK
jgi:hypothetical protein